MREVLPGPSQLLVLGGGLEPTGQPNQVTQERIDRAYGYAVLHDVGKIVVSGRRSWTDTEVAGLDVSEGQVMRDALLDRGLPAAIVQAESNSNNTVQNFGFSIREGYLDPKLWTGVVTHRFQQARARLIANLTLEQSPRWILAPQPHLEYVRHELAVMPLTLLTIAGIKRGEIDPLLKRNDRVQAASGQLLQLRNGLTDYRRKRTA